MKYWISLVAAAACGGGSDMSAIDAAGDPVDATVVVDGSPACAPAVPTKLALAPGGASAPAFASLFVMTSTGEVGIPIYDGANGQAMLTWEGTAWTPHAMFGNTNGGFGRNGVGEFAGRPVYFADISDQSTDSDKLRYWLQLPSGMFATGARLEQGSSGLEVRVSRYSPAHQVLAAAGGDQAKTVMSFERNAAGAWTVQTVFSNATNGSEYGAGVGALTDGTAIVAAAGSAGFQTFRRTGTQWSLHKTLATGGVFDAQLAFPPEGSTASSAVAIFIDATSHKLRGSLVSLADGTPSAPVDLLPDAGLTAVDSSVAFEPSSSTKGKILVVDGNFSQPRAWIIGFEGTSFTAAQELHPDRVNETYPHLGYHPCGGYMIEYASRLPTDAAGSSPLMFDKLSTYAPGL